MYNKWKNDFIWLARGDCMIEKDLMPLYGHYEIPKEIMELHQLEEQLQKDGLSFELIGFQPLRELYTYSMTPPDSIPFAHTGGAGIHFAFLTDFGQVNSLQEAPIICVSPTNDPPIRYVARNLREFLQLVVAVLHAEMLEQFWGYKDEAMMNREIEEFLHDSPADWTKNRQAVHARFKEAFDLQPLSFLSYVQDVLQERAQSIAVDTFDGLGIKGARTTSPLKRYEFGEHFTVNNEELERMRQFLERASRMEKQAFIRDANYRFVVVPAEEKGLFELMLSILKELGLESEVASMLTR